MNEIYIRCDQESLIKYLSLIKKIAEKRYTFIAFEKKHCITKDGKIIILEFLPKFLKQYPKEEMKNDFRIICSIKTLLIHRIKNNG